MNPKNPNSGRYASDGQDHDDLSYLGNLADSDDPPYPDPFFETPYDFNTPADFGTSITIRTEDKLVPLS